MHHERRDETTDDAGKEDGELAHKSGKPSSPSAADRSPQWAADEETGVHSRPDYPVREVRDPLDLSAQPAAR